MHVIIVVEPDLATPLYLVQVVSFLSSILSVSWSDFTCCSSPVSPLAVSALQALQGESQAWDPPSPL